MDKYLKLNIRNAGFNIPKEFRYPNKVDLVSLPYSTLRGAIYALLGERPPSRFNPNLAKLFRIKWIDELISQSIFKIYDVDYLTHSDDSIYSSGSLKTEVYFKRKDEFVEEKNLNADSYNTRGYQDFFDELKKLYKISSTHLALLEFRKDCALYYSTQTSPEKSMAQTRVNFLKKLQDERKRNWRLSDGYLKFFYSRYWISEMDLGGNATTLGVRGAPGYKFVFDADVLMPITSTHIAKDISLKLNNGSKVVSFGEGGLLWPSLLKGISFLHISDTSDYHKLKKTEIFKEKEL